MYDYELRKSIEKTFFKLAKKNPKQLEIIHDKIEEIRFNPHHYKSLRYPLQFLRRTHIDKSFVLVFSIEESRNCTLRVQKIYINFSSKVNKCVYTFLYVKKNSDY